MPNYPGAELSGAHCAVHCQTIYFHLAFGELFVIINFLKVPQKDGQDLSGVEVLPTI